MKIVTVTLRNQNVSPRKAQLVMSLIRGMEVEKAMGQLVFSSKKSAKFAHALLKSAVSAAKEKDYEASDLVISEAISQEGPRMKRFFIRARGRSTSYHKRSSHLKISLAKKGEDKPAKELSKTKDSAKSEQKINKKESSNGTKS